MHCIIFAGGVGKRLWPLSRMSSPKQFEKLKDNTSTLQMAVNRVRPFGFEKVFVATNERYAHLVQEQIPDLSSDRLLIEPARRDLAAAVGLALIRLKKRGVSGTVSVLWADHFMQHEDAFRGALLRAESLIQANPHQFVFLGEHPRFANHNLGWMKVGEEIGDGVHQFVAWKYRPEKGLCEKMFASGEWLWNPGYFVFDIDFALSLYERFQPALYQSLCDMVADETNLKEKYEQLPALHFDEAIIEHLDPEQAVVLPVNLGWSDPGTLYALKEALEPVTEKNVSRGEVSMIDVSDSLLINEESNVMLAVVGLEGIVVINTKDAVLVCEKDRVGDIKTLLEQFETGDKKQYL